MTWENIIWHHLHADTRHLPAGRGDLFSPKSPQSIGCPKVQQHVETVRVTASAWCMKNYPGWIHCLQHWKVRKSHLANSQCRFDALAVYTRCEIWRNPHALMAAGSAYGMMYLLHIGQGHSLITKSHKRLTTHGWSSVILQAKEFIIAPFANISCTCCHSPCPVTLLRCLFVVDNNTNISATPWQSKPRLMSSEALCCHLLMDDWITNSSSEPSLSDGSIQICFTSLEVVISCLRYSVRQWIFSEKNILYYWIKISDIFRCKHH